MTYDTDGKCLQVACPALGQGSGRGGFLEVFYFWLLWS